MREFQRWLIGQLEAVNRREQVLTLAHVGLSALEQGSVSQTDPAVKAAKTLREWVAKARMQPHHRPPVATFSTHAADASFDLFARAVHVKLSLPDLILRWVLQSDLTDETTPTLRKVLHQHKITSNSPPGTGLAASDGGLGFGEPIDRDWRAPADDDGFEGRDADLQRHLGFLTAAISRGRPYVLEGQAGVGKSRFLRALLRFASDRWAGASDRTLNDARFVLFTPRDFSGPEAEIEERMQSLHEHIRARPSTVPVFDGVEILLRGARGALFESMLGGLVHGPVVFVGRTAAIMRAELLRDVRPVSIAPLRVEATARIARRRIELLCQAMRLEVEGGAETFCNGLVRLASERYPGRFFPEVALHLVESVVPRALNRTAFLNQDPHGLVTERDLREHVAEEQGIAAEVLGKDSRDFYTRVAAELGEDVRGQGHAIDHVCRALLAQANAPPKATPRGRFLFVGPPGVGKTHLARSLARRLGLGDEAFFVFNMSEYSSDSARTRFMGSDPGYVGFKSTRTIYDLVRARPSCVVLFDEVDRADGSIQDILLSILEGQGKDSEGESVYFSQTIFVMTTNQGQEQVADAYQSVVRGELTREQLTREFDDHRLRGLLLEGVLGDAELEMKTFVEQRLATLQVEFKDTAEQMTRYALIDEYLGLQDRHRGLEVRTRRARFDRAFLDRIDFVVPFFPIKERELLDQICGQVLAREGCTAGPEERALIVDEAFTEKESVRALERIVKKHAAAQVKLGDEASEHLLATSTRANSRNGT